MRRPEPEVKPDAPCHRGGAAVTDAVDGCQYLLRRSLAPAAEQERPAGRPVSGGRHRMTRITQPLD
jgi:hypothetical protein